MAEAVTALDYRGNTNQPTEASIEGTATAPAAGATIASLTLQAGTYTVSWGVGFTAGTPAAGDANNFGVYNGATLQEQSVNPAAIGEYQQTQVQVTSTGVTTVTIKAVGAGTAGVTYAANLTAVPIQSSEEDVPPSTIPAIRVNGSTVVLGSGQTVTLAGFDNVGDQAECQLGNGGNIPAGSSQQGFVDTTYTLTAAQLAAGSLMGA